MSSSYPVFHEGGYTKLYFRPYSVFTCLRWI